jgi:hypothetical protein
VEGLSVKKFFLFLSTCLLPAFPIFTPRVFAQTAAELETLLYTDAVNYGQAARFVLLAADIIDLRAIDGAESIDAFRYAMEKKWLPAGATQDAAAKLDGVSLLVMQAFNMKGGAFYTLIRTPHYAYRELLYQNVIQGRADSDMIVSGDLLLFVVNRVLEQIESNK